MEDHLPEHHIHHTINKLAALSDANPKTGATNEVIFTFAFLLTKLAEVASNNAAIHASLLKKAEVITDKNLKLQAKVVKLTWALFALTFILAIVAAVQTYFIFADRP